MNPLLRSAIAARAEQVSPGLGALSQVALGANRTAARRPPKAAEAGPNWEGPTGDIQTMAKRMARKEFGKGHWNELNNLVSHESSWNPKADNPTSSAYGLFQFLDSTRQNYGIGLNAGPRKQIRAGLDYIKDRYGTPTGAWDFWEKNRWY